MVTEISAVFWQLKVTVSHHEVTVWMVVTDAMTFVGGQEAVSSDASQLSKAGVTFAGHPEISFYPLSWTFFVRFYPVIDVSEMGTQSGHDSALTLELN